MNQGQALSSFEKVLNLRRLSFNTVHMYLYYIRRFLEYSNVDDVTRLSLEHAQDFISFLYDELNYQPKSANVVISAIDYFFDAVLDHPLSRRKLPRAKYNKADRYIFSESEIRQLLNTADVRLRCIILLGYDCGLRVSETANLHISDIDSKNMVIHIRNSKRNKSRFVKLSSLCLQELRSYWCLYRPVDYMFPDRKGSAAGPGTVNRWFHTYYKTMPFYNDSVHYHNLRHTYATNMLNNGCSLLDLKYLLGHASINSTAIYTHYSYANVKDNSSPSDCWSR